MADKKISALSAVSDSAIGADDLLHIVDNPGGTPVNKKMTINDYYSPTTARHINSFLDYYGYPTMSKSEMLSVKGTKFEKGGAISSNYFSGMLSFLNY